MSSARGSSSSSKSKFSRLFKRGSSSSHPPPPPPQQPQFDPIELDLDNVEIDLEGDDAEVIRQFMAENPHISSQEESGPPPPTTEIHGSGRAPRPPREPKSSIFAYHMTRTELPQEAGMPKSFLVQCNYCTKNYTLRSGGGYGSYKKHLEVHHPDKLGIDPTQTQIRGTPSGSSSQGTDSSSPLFRYSEANARRHLAKFVCATHQPFNFADNEFYEDFAKLALNPSARKVSRTTLTREIAKVVGEFKIVLIGTFASLQQKVSICADIWSDNYQTNSYMGVTSHWIDDTWTIQKRLIAYRYFPTPHNAIGIAHKILSILQEYKLQNKIFSISFDNASANTASLPTLIDACQPSCGGKFFHIRCLCHILNLCVQDGLSCFSEHITPIRDGIKLIMQHQNLLKKWSRFCKIKGKHPKKFVWDVPHRWNSTYKMLNDSYEYKEILCEFFIQNEINNIQLLPQSWDSCANLTQLLKIFENATKQLSGCYYPTSPLVVDHCVKIALIFSHYRNDPILSGPINNMKTKWVKYFYEIPDVFLIAKNVRSYN